MRANLVLIREWLLRRSGKLVAAGILLSIAQSRAQTLDDVARAHETLLADKSLQFDFAELTQPRRPDWLESLAEILKRVFDLLAPVIAVVFWAGVVAIAAGLLFLVGREAYRRSARRPAKPGAGADEPYLPAPTLARAFLEEADRLAGEGRFAEAVHVLLFKTIEDIERRRPHHVRKAMTSREIAGLAILPAPARAAFAEIAEAVERSEFAGRTIGAEVFAECRSAYRGFAAPEGWA